MTNSLPKNVAVVAESILHKGVVVVQIEFSAVSRIDVPWNSSDNLCKGPLGLSSNIVS